ncbi:S-layer homology domain-containing protein [Lysinibacillus irui]|uniref:S-layer homology domain-containing protein n=1 Tax=Lysinibacillus irui TaxID=2998077 RepID=A0AAJ5URY0_9BACI|nr:S-layer homology domain-containing protein [Lysinibacillus irui]WDV07421.1 S-layer homology domain-containing protein [Lysinibacillus irui]
MAKQNKGRKFFAASATAALVASAIVPVASAAQVNDYNKISGYAKEAVQSLVDKGVIQGDTNGNFNPLNTVTRAQAAEIFTKALELEADGEVNFKDVKAGAWYYNSIAAVVANGIFEGVSATEFAPNKSLTRSEAAKVLVDAFGLEGSESLGQFADASQVKPWAKSALETAVANGIFTGSEENGKLNLKPNAAITRQDFAVVFARTLDLVDAETPVDASIKAINSTTVEVTFDEEVDTDNVTAGNFKIDGLEVKNAAIKQTNKKVVVLTTATQTADKEYVLSYKDEEIGKFKGIAAVIPTAIKMVTPSVQGTIGKEATVSAQVTVPEGQSKAGIPVTFNIAADTNNQLNQKIEVVAYTNEEGIASYSYTRYYKYNDQVTAYASEKSSVYASAKVYWAEGLTITEATTGNDLANGAKKVYKIKTDKYNTQYVGTSNTVDYNYVNVAFKENVDVAPDKLVRDVEVIDTGVSTNAKYPSQVTTGGVNVVRVKVNSNGEATFTLTGSNASVTPIVFVDESKNLVGKYTETALQAAAPTVKFALSHTLGLTVKAEGEQNAAAYNSTPTSKTNAGGRNYVATLTDKEGKIAPEGSTVYVTFEDGNLSKDKSVTVLVTDKDGNVTSHAATIGARIPVKVVGTKGEAKFRVVGQKDAYAKPTVYVENGTDSTKLDKNDLQTVAETTYFVDAKVANATLKVKNATSDKEVTSLSTANAAVFEYQSVDQNGFNYHTTNSNYEVSYQVTAQFADVKLFADAAQTTPVNFTDASGALTNVVKAGTTATVKVNAVSGLAKLYVASLVPSNVTVNASASQVSLPNQNVTVSFTSSSELPAVHTGYVTGLDEKKETIKIDGFDAVSYDGGSYFNHLNQPLNKTEFVTALKSVKANEKAQITVTKQADGTYKFNILSLTVVKTPEEQLAEAKTALEAKKQQANKLVSSNYTAASWKAYTDAKALADAMPESNLTEVQAKTTAIDAAINLLVTISSEQEAEAAANKKLADAINAASTKKEEDYKASTWTALTTAKAMQETTVNQKIAKADAINAAIAGLVAKAMPVVAVNVDESNITTGELKLTFTETNETIELGSILNSASTTAGETVAVTGAGTNVLVLTVKDATTNPVNLGTAKDGKYSFDATITVTGANAGEYKAQDVKLTIEFDTNSNKWVAKLVNK